MNIRAYIESGILERFVMGETNEAESLEVMNMSKNHPEVQAEIEAIEETLMDFAKLGAVKPKSDTKTKLMDVLFEADNKTVEFKAAENREMNNVVSIQSGVSRYKIWLAAASIALLISVGSNFLLYKNWVKSENAFLALNTEKQSLVDNQKTLEASYNELSNNWQKITSETVVQVKLKGISIQPDALATLYYDNSNKDVYLQINKLNEAPEGKQFQLWAIVDGTPVDAGVFDANNESTLIKLKQSEKPAIFAVTIENKGGSPTPTLDKMVLIGNVQS
jgi:anti-sigma-K factor RskA